MRIASLQPSISITLAGLDRLDTLCACTRYCVEALPELATRNLPVLEDSWTFARPGNFEILLAAKPDLVIASVPYRMESFAAILKSGLPILALTPHNLAGIATDIRLIASLVDARQRGDALNQQMSTTIEAIRLKTTGVSKPLVYCEEWGKPLIHSQQWVAELVDAAGGRYLGIPGAHTTAEQIAAADPDILLFAWCGAGDRVPLARVIEQRSWHSLRAVQSRNVFCVPDEFLNTPAPTLSEGLASIAGATHPDLFPPHPRVIRLAEPLIVR